MIEKTGNPNIALIKYWGKKNDKIFPTTSSISVLLKDLYTKTKMIENNKDEIYINGILQVGKEHEKIVNYINLYRDDNRKFKVETFNSFATAAGLSSSSSGIVALSKCLLFYYPKKSKQLLELTRYGSGSSCRGYTKGFTVWNTRNDVYQLKTKMKLYCYIIQISDKKKKISSREAMKIAKETSTLYAKWVKDSKKHFRKAIISIRRNDFKNLRKVVIQNFMLMHKTLLYSNLKYTYISKESKEVLDILNNMNDVIFTMDAGPNIKVFCKKKDKEKISEKLKRKIKYKILKSDIYD